MTYPRTIVGLFHSSGAAELAVEHLLGAGFAPSAIRQATQATLRGQLPAGAAPATDTSHESLRDGILRFFAEVFTGHDEDPSAYADAAHADSAVVTVSATSASAADTARQLLDTSGAVDVYKQAARLRESLTAGRPAGIDLEGDLSRVRDHDELDANGLTTH